MLGQDHVFTFPGSITTNRLSVRAYKCWNTVSNRCQDANTAYILSNEQISLWFYMKACCTVHSLATIFFLCGLVVLQVSFYTDHCTSMLSYILKVLQKQTWTLRFCCKNSHCMRFSFHCDLYDILNSNKPNTFQQSILSLRDWLFLFISRVLLFDGILMPDVIIHSWWLYQF